MGIEIKKLMDDVSNFRNERRVLTLAWNFRGERYEGENFRYDVLQKCIRVDYALKSGESGTFSFDEFTQACDFTYTYWDSEQMRVISVSGVSVVE